MVGTETLSVEDTAFLHGRSVHVECALLTQIVLSSCYTWCVCVHNNNMHTYLCCTVLGMYQCSCTLL